MINSYKSNTIYENADCLLSYLPDGRLFAAKNIDGSNLRKLYTAFAAEYTRLQNKIYELSVETDLTNTTNLIDEWESALGIPDTCLTNTVPIEQRRKQLVAKFALMNILTEKDWIDLAWFFGFRIEISYGNQHSIFPMIFPIYFDGSPKAARFTMIITFMGLEKPTNIFTARFPIQFYDPTKFMRCIFSKLKPANVALHFNWEF